ncbi:hypothetical protein [Salmonirosea aquatica]|uniref:Glycosyltransferase RgtA/B/C/D-like domain-containing protein n=1 Tax=Salmonirosea aquatica TaxID=2654236 RepID=A0A7C9BDZ4_9BACT|nr:hypothetical protein [Cytophagaceae bacterium SJW1-29]
MFIYSETLFFADDFHLLKTIVWFQETDSFYEKIALLLQQHNEHRILFPRLLTWLDYRLEGHINWPVLMVLGNMVWCGVLYFLWDAFRTLRLNPWLFLPIPWLLFHPFYYDNLTWTISVLQQSVIVFILAWLVHAFTNRRFLLAIGIVLLGTFTHGNGIFGFAVGIVFLVIYREWRWLGIWLLVALITAFVYFYGFERGQSADFARSLSDPLRLIAYFCTFLGSVTQVFGPHDWPSVAWGAIVFLGIAWFGFPKIYAQYRSGPPLSYFEKMLLGNLLFLGITALLVAVSRSWSATDFLIPPRYAHYSPYITAWFYLVGIAVLARSYIWYWSLPWGILAVLIWLVSYLNYFTTLEYRRDWLRADKANWENYDVFLQYAPSFNRNIRDVYHKAVDRGICYHPSGLPSQLTGASTDSTLALTFERGFSVSQDASGEYREKILRVGNKSNASDTPFLALVAEGQPVVWVPYYRLRNAYRGILRGMDYGKKT